MARMLLRWMALCWFALVAVQCGSGGNGSVEILVRVRSLPTDVAVLSVSAVLNGRRAMSGVEFAQQLSQFTVTLPMDASSEGVLELNVTALAPDRCRTANGRIVLTVALAHPYTEVEVGLVQLPAKLCTLTVEKIGNGTVTIAPPGIDCGNACQVELPYGTQVKLSTQRGPGWFVTDWGSVCNGAQYGPAGACDVPLTAPTGVVVKLSDGFCSTRGWCWSNSVPQGNSLLKVWGKDAANVWAVGNGGTILKWNGSAWSSQSSGTTQFLNSVWGSDASNVWAVGNGGTVLKWNGSAWSSQSSGTTQSLNSVWGSDASNIWAVGNGGTILNGDYDHPIRTYTDSRMETSCERPACPNQVMSAFRTRPRTQIVEHETLMALMSNPGAQSATCGCRRICKPPMGYRSMRKLPRSSNTLRSMV